MENQNYTNCSYQEPDSYCCHNTHMFQSIVANGIYYYPAWKHYGRVVTVICDRCQKHGLTACIGLNSQDLCITCVDELTKFGSNFRMCY